MEEVGGEGRVLDGGAGSEASLEGAGVEASRAAGGSGRPAGDGHSLRHLFAHCCWSCWLGGWMGGLGRGGVLYRGGGAGAFSHNQHQHLTQEKQQQVNIRAI